MTTAGVDAFQPDRVDALWYPSYNYHYPAFKQRQLCEYYDCYRARPPPNFWRTSAERMRQECQCFKGKIIAAPGTTRRECRLRNSLLPLDCRACQEKEPPDPAVIPAKLPPDFLLPLHVRAKEYARWRFETTPMVTTQTRSEWNNFLNRCPERFDIQLPATMPGDGTQPYFDGGYSLRFLRPDLTRGMGMEKWREKSFGTIQGPATDSPYREIVTTPAIKYG